MPRKRTQPIRMSIEFTVIGVLFLAGAAIAVACCVATGRGSFSFWTSGIDAIVAGSMFSGFQALWTTSLIARREIALEGEFEPSARAWRREAIRCAAVMAVLIPGVVLLTSRSLYPAALLGAYGIGALANAVWMGVWERRNHAWLMRLPGLGHPRQFILADQTREHGFAQYLTEPAR